MGILLLSTPKLAVSDTIAISDAITMLFGKEVAESVAISDAIEMLVSISREEQISISDIVESYIFRHNRPLQKYETRMLVDMNLASGVKRLSTEDIYVQN